MKKTIISLAICALATTAITITAHAATTSVTMSYSTKTTYTSSSYDMGGTFTKIKLYENPECLYSVAKVTDRLQQKSGLIWSTKDDDQTWSVGSSHTSWWYADEDDDYRIKVTAVNNVEEGYGNIGDITYNIICSNSRLYISN